MCGCSLSDIEAFFPNNLGSAHDFKNAALDLDIEDIEIAILLLQLRDSWLTTLISSD
jgi:hypothetical protein